MTATRRWVVMPSGFPFSVPGNPIGSVLAEDRGAAIKLAESIFGKQVVVETERAASSDIAGSEIGAVREDGEFPARVSAAFATHSPRAMRVMSQLEIQMARAVGVVRNPGPHKGTIRRLHAESFKPTPEISDELAKKLRGIVHALRGQLPPEIVESVGAP